MHLTHNMDLLGPILVLHLAPQLYLDCGRGLLKKLNLRLILFGLTVGDYPSPSSLHCLHAGDQLVHESWGISQLFHFSDQ